MSKSNTFENDWLKAVFNATAIANLLDNAASSPLTSLYVAFHTADPGEAGDQTTNEAAYTGYARTAVARTSGGWTVTNNSVSPAANVDAPKCTAASSEVLTHWSVGTASSGSGKILYKGELGTRQGGFTAKASDDTFTIPGITGVAVNDRIVFHAINGFSLPTGITDGTVYFVKTVSGTAVTISTTAGGSTLDVTADGVGTAVKVTPISMGLNVIPRLETGTTITED